jgi:NADPH-dependent curcumin reductase CurA
MTYINQTWVLRRRPHASVAQEDLELTLSPVRPLAKGELLVRNIYMSLDPTNRLWMSDREQYLPPVGISDVMRGGTIGVVE